MKRLLAMLLALMMLLAFAACGKDNTTKETTTETNAETTTNAPANNDIAVDTPVATDNNAILAGPTNVFRGGVSDNSYSSAFNGVTFTADETWTFYTDEEIASLTGLSADAIANENFQSTIDTEGGAYDVMAVRISSEGVMEAMFSLSYINGNDASLESMTLEDLVKLTAESSGSDLSNTESKKVTYGGQEYYQLVCTNEKSISYISACEMDGVIVFITAAATPDCGVDFSKMIK